MPAAIFATHVYNVCRLYTFDWLFWTLRTACFSGLRGGRAFRGEAAVFFCGRGAGRRDRRLLVALPSLRLSRGSLGLGGLAVQTGRSLQGKVIHVWLDIVVKPGGCVCLRQAEVAGDWQSAAGNRARCSRVGNVIYRCSFRTFVRLVKAISALLFYVR